jgi:hypothetical protein
MVAGIKSPLRITAKSKPLLKNRGEKAILFFISFLDKWILIIIAEQSITKTFL